MTGNDKLAIIEQIKRMQRSQQQLSQSLQLAAATINDMALDTSFISIVTALLETTKSEENDGNNSHGH